MHQMVTALPSMKSLPELSKAPKMRNPFKSLSSKISKTKNEKTKKLEEKIDQIKIGAIPILEKN